MKKILAPIVLGLALLAPCGSAFAEKNRPAEPRWEIKPERSAPKLLDLSRWLSQRIDRLFGLSLEEGGVVPEPVPPPPPPGGDPPNETCPDRRHCPWT